MFAQPVVDEKGVRTLDKWYAGGCRVFIGWASTKNTSGANPAQDRSAQLEWRAAVRALGPDAVYVDYPLPDWRYVATAADVKLMVDDPQCLGFYAPDEFNRKNKAGTDFVVSAAEWRAYWDPIDAADPNRTKVRVGDYAGALLTAAWGFYTGADVRAAFAPRLTDGATNWHPRNVYGDTRGDCDDYPGRAVLMLGKVNPNARRWYISECAREELSSSPAGRAPTPAELDAQYAGVIAQDNAAAPVTVWAWFPQRPRNNASHVFDNTTPEQFEAVKRINARFTGLAPPTTQPADPAIAEMRARVANLETQVTAANAAAADSRAAADVANAAAAAAGARADAAHATLDKIIAAFPRPAAATQPTTQPAGPP